MPILQEGLLKLKEAGAKELPAAIQVKFSTRMGVLSNELAALEEQYKEGLQSIQKNENQSNSSAVGRSGIAVQRFLMGADPFAVERGKLEKDYNTQKEYYEHKQALLIIKCKRLANWITHFRGYQALSQGTQEYFILKRYKAGPNEVKIKLIKDEVREAIRQSVLQKTVNSSLEKHEHLTKKLPKIIQSKLEALFTKELSNTKSSGKKSVSVDEFIQKRLEFLIEEEKTARDRANEVLNNIPGIELLSEHELKKYRDEISLIEHERISFETQHQINIYDKALTPSSIYNPFVSATDELFREKEGILNKLKKSTDTIKKDISGKLAESVELAIKSHEKSIKLLPEEHQKTLLDALKSEDFMKETLKSKNPNIDEIVENRIDNLKRLEKLSVTRAKERFESIPGHYLLTEIEINQHLKDLRLVEYERIEFEETHHVDVFDEKQFPLSGSLTVTPEIKLRRERNAILGKFLDITQEMNQEARHNVMESKGVSKEIEATLQGQTHIPEKVKDLFASTLKNLYSDRTLLKEKTIDPELLTDKKAETLESVELKIQTLEAEIAFGEKLYSMPEFEKIKTLYPQDQIEEIRKYFNATSKLNGFLDEKNELEKKIEKESDEKERKDYQAELATLQGRIASETEIRQSFNKNYFYDKYLKNQDDRFGYQEPEPKGYFNLLGNDIYSRARKLWYNENSSNARWGLGLGVLASIPIAYSLGAGYVISAVVAGAAGSVACVAQPKLIRPLGFATAAMYVCWLGLPAIVAVPVGIGAGVAADQAIRHSTKIKAIYDFAVKAIEFITKALKQSEPITEAFYAALKVLKGEAPFANGTRLVAIAAGIGLGIFIAASILTGGGLPAAVGGLILGYAGAWLGSWVGKKIVEVGSKLITGFKDYEKYYLTSEAREKLGTQNSLKLGKHFEHKIKELNKKIEKMKTLSKNPDLDIAIIDEQNYVTKLEETMFALKNARGNMTKLKTVLDQYIKDEYELKRTQYLALTDPTHAKAKETAKKGIDDLEEMHNLSNHIQTLIPSKETKSSLKLPKMPERKHLESEPSVRTGVLLHHGQHKKETKTLEHHMEKKSLKETEKAKHPEHSAKNVNTLVQHKSSNSTPKHTSNESKKSKSPLRPKRPDES